MTEFLYFLILRTHRRRLHAGSSAGNWLNRNCRRFCRKFQPSGFLCRSCGSSETATDAELTSGSHVLLFWAKRDARSKKTQNSKPKEDGNDKPTSAAPSARRFQVLLRILHMFRIGVLFFRQSLLKVRVDTRDTFFNIRRPLVLNW